MDDMVNASESIPNEVSSRNENTTSFVDLRCIVVRKKALKWTVVTVAVVILLIGVSVALAILLPKHKYGPKTLDQDTQSRQPQMDEDQYSEALHKALLFFNAQKSGKLPKDNGIEWRGDSGLQDGRDVNEDLVVGYYDSGENTKSHLNMSFAMTMLSWSVLEYENKYKAINEYDHAREIIKWGADYLLRTFNSSASKIDHIYSQVGGSRNGSKRTDDQTCWQRPEDMDYNRPSQMVTDRGFDLAGEMVAALASASIVFRDDAAYSKKLVKAATKVWRFVIEEGMCNTGYCGGHIFLDPYDYNSTGYNDEYMWGTTWMYFATDDDRYLWLAVKEVVPNNVRRIFHRGPSQSRVLGWENKWPAAMLLLTSFRLFYQPVGDLYDRRLDAYHNATSLTMCSYLQQYQVFNWTQGGLIELNHGRPQNLQYVVNAVFLASLYADYLDSIKLPGWYCGSTFIPLKALRDFGTFQVDYILGKNPMNMSYIVGHGNKYPTHVHHRGASIPNNNITYSCKGGSKWMSSSEPNPNTITGAMVGGPDQFDMFQDNRLNKKFTEPTLVGNAGLVAALVSLTGGNRIEKKSMFSAIAPLHREKLRMHASNHWGGALEIVNDDDPSRRTSNIDESDRAALFNSNQIQRQDVTPPRDATQQSWMLDPNEALRRKNKTKYVDLGCVVVKWEILKWTLIALFVAFIVIGLPIIIVKSIPKHIPGPPPPDQYTEALHKALMFFNAQKSGKLPKNNGVKWRGNSGLQDGASATDVKGGLVGGYYDAGDNTKFHFPMSFAMTMLSWSVLEYEDKYKSINEYDHTRELIKWGTDYLLRTFNSSASIIDHIYGQVGGSRNQSTTPDDHNCWERPEDMDYERITQRITSGPDLAGEMAAALASASIVFKDDTKYSQKLLHGATTVWTFAQDSSKNSTYSKDNDFIEPYYNSTGYYDEYIWGGAWMYYATGNYTYLLTATNEEISRNAKALADKPSQRVLSWDNKLPAAMLLLTRIRLYLNPGYPYEGMLGSYHKAISLTMCSYLKQYKVFRWTRGGLIGLSEGRPQNLQYVSNAVFLASLYTDYLDGVNLPGWYCGATFIPLKTLRDFASYQMKYILGENPMSMSYVVGYGTKYPTHVHHRGASIPHNNIKYSCKGGLQWMTSGKPNPNTITGAMVGGPDQFDHFKDVRSNYNYTEPTLAGNAGLVAALASLTATAGDGVDKNSIFSRIPSLYIKSPPPPAPWKP